MAYHLQVTETIQNISFNCKYQNMSNYEKPEIVAKAPNGKEVFYRTVYQGTVLHPGSTQKQWMDEDENIYSKSELTFYYKGEPVEENSMTKVFVIESYEPLSFYTDKFVIDKYYELMPSDNKRKKDIDRDIAIKTNTSLMYKLWEHLYTNKAVGRGEFVAASRGFVASDGYLRAVLTEKNDSVLELGSFKETKEFHYPLAKVEMKEMPKPEIKKRIKMI